MAPISIKRPVTKPALESMTPRMFSSKCSIRVFDQRKLFKAMLTCDLRGQVAGHQLSPFQFRRGLVGDGVCVAVRVCRCF